MPNYYGPKPVQLRNGRVPVVIGYSTPVGDHEQEDDLSAVITIEVPDDAGVWMVQVADQDVRFTLDGTTPTATLGFIIKANQAPLSIGVEPGGTIKVIEVIAGAKIEYQFLD